MQSPEGSSSLPSLCSPNSLSQEDEFAFMSTNLDNDDIDLSMRAPYIPMNENDDLPLLTEDLMWSAFSDELSLHKDMKDATLQQQLLVQQQQHQQQLQTNLIVNNHGNSVIDVNNVIIHTNGASNDDHVSSKIAATNARLAKDASNLAVLLSPNAYSIENDKQTALLSAELLQSQCHNRNVKYEQTQQSQNGPDLSRCDDMSAPMGSKYNRNMLFQQQNASKTANGKCARSHLASQTTTSTATVTASTSAPITNNNSSSKMEVIDSVDGSITTYTIEMLDDDAYSKNCKCKTTQRIPATREFMIHGCALMTFRCHLPFGVIPLIYYSYFS